MCYVVCLVLLSSSTKMRLQRGLSHSLYSRGILETIYKEGMVPKSQESRDLVCPGPAVSQHTAQVTESGHSLLKKNAALPCCGSLWHQFV